MERGHFILLVSCTLFIFLVMLVIYSFSPLNREIYRGPFDRTFTAAPVLQQEAMMDLGVNSYYISGMTVDKVYLSNYTSPFHLIVTNTILTDSQHVRLKLVGVDSSVIPGMFRTYIDPPYFFIGHGYMAEILRGNINSWEAQRIMPDSAYYFLEALPVSPTTLVVRSYNKVHDGYELAKKTSLDTPYFQFKPGILERQIDGLFSVEGKLHYSKTLHKIVYLYSYRNQFIVMDTSLNLAYRGNTIDTFHVAQIKVAETESKRERMLASPANVINRKSCVFDKHLFIQCNLLAKNEDVELFKKASVIDIYDLTVGTYVRSFYIPDFKGSRLSDFRIVQNQVVALFDHYLISFDLNKKIYQAPKKY